MLVNACSGYVCTLALALNASVLNSKKAKARIVSFYLLIIAYVVLLIRRLINQYSDEYLFSVAVSVASAVSTLFVVHRWWDRKQTSPKYYYGVITGGSFAATIGIIIAFILRFTDWGNHIEGCDLNSAANNTVGFGQVTAIVLSFNIVLAIIDAVFGMVLCRTLGFV